MVLSILKDYTTAAPTDYEAGALSFNVLKVTLGNKYAFPKVHVTFTTLRPQLLD